MTSMVAGKDDEALLTAFRAGQGQAFEAIVRRHYPMLLRAAEQRCGAGALAEDAVQTALIRAHRFLTSNGAVENLGGWLRRIVSNCALDLAKRERRDVADLSLLEGRAAPDDPALERRELRALVLAAIERLPETYHAPLTLRFLHGVEAREIAERLDDNLNSVKSRLARGRRELRRRLESVLERGGYL